MNHCTYTYEFPEMTLMFGRKYGVHASQGSFLYILNLLLKNEKRKPEKTKILQTETETYYE